MSDIFGGADQAPAATHVTQATTQPAVDPQADLLKQITNDSGEQKYQDIPTALNALVHSQNHIKTLESDTTTALARIQELEAQLAERNKLESLVEQLQTQPPVATAPVMPTGLDESAVNALLEQKLAQQAQQQVYQSNTQSVVQTLQSKFGDKASEAFYGKAAELGMSKEQINDLARTSPQAVLAFFGASHGKSVAPTTSSINTTAFSQVKLSDKVEPSSRSVMMGATKKDMLAEMRRHKEHVYAKNGVTL